MEYKFLPHTADIKFQAFGKTLEQAFENSAYALKQIITEDKVKAKQKKIIKVQGKDKEELLVNFLEEFLFSLDSENFLLSEIVKIKINKSNNKQQIKALKKEEHKNKQDSDNNTHNINNNYELTAEVLGDSSESYEIKNCVKAITYNEIFVKEEKNKFICQIVVDV